MPGSPSIFSDRPIQRATVYGQALWHVSNAAQSGLPLQAAVMGASQAPVPSPGAFCVMHRSQASPLTGAGAPAAPLQSLIAHWVWHFPCAPQMHASSAVW